MKKTYRTIFFTTHEYGVEEITKVEHFCKRKIDNEYLGDVHYDIPHKGWVFKADNYKTTLTINEMADILNFMVQL